MKYSKILLRKAKQQKNEREKFQTNIQIQNHVTVLSGPTHDETALIQ